MITLVQFVRRRWIVSLLALVLMLVLGEMGWRNWRRVAIEHALDLRVGQLWFDDRGRLHADVRCRFDRERLPLWYKVACPASLSQRFHCIGVRLRMDCEQSFQGDQYIPADGPIFVDRNAIDDWHMPDETLVDVEHLRTADVKDAELRVGGQLVCFASAANVEDAASQAVKKIQWSRQLHSWPPALIEPILNFFFWDTQEFSLATQIVDINLSKPRSNLRVDGRTF